MAINTNQVFFKKDFEIGSGKVRIEEHSKRFAGLVLKYMGRASCDQCGWKGPLRAAYTERGRLFKGLSLGVDALRHSEGCETANPIVEQKQAPEVIHLVEAMELIKRLIHDDIRSIERKYNNGNRAVSIQLLLGYIDRFEQIADSALASLTAQRQQEGDV